jgi:GDP-L-fucose synthase
MLSHINVGSGYELTIKEAALSVAEVVGYRGDIEFDASKPDGTRRKLMDSGRLEKLGWKASIDLKHGLKQAYADYLAKA